MSTPSLPAAPAPERPAGRRHPEERPADRVPWLPDSLRAHRLGTADVTAYWYVVVDEIVDDLVTLSVASWPTADLAGRVRFALASDRGHVLVRRSELAEAIYRGWLRRQPRVGDTFAAQMAAAAEAALASGQDVVCDADRELADVLTGSVYDITADARRVAKLAYYAAAVPPQPAQTTLRHRQTDRVDDRFVGRRSPAPPRQVRRRTTSRPLSPPPEQELRRVAAGADVEAKHLVDDDLVAALRADPEALVYFLLNVGDGDTQLLLLPVDRRTAHRRAVVVDVATNNKLPSLLAELRAAELLPPAGTPGLFPVVVATHPHEDHIGGLPQFLDREAVDGAVVDFWQPGYYHGNDSFVETMVLLEDRGILQTEPTSGTARYAGPVRLTALGPGVGLRSRFDSYGVEINDASITLRVDFPAVRVSVTEDELDTERDKREYLRLTTPWSLILGADAQTTSWAQAAIDFPQLHRHADGALYRELAAARGRDHLRAQVFKVSHHASKHGVNLELLERIDAQLNLVSSVCGGGKYNFPHLLATEALREARRATAGKRSAPTRAPDVDLGIHYTGSRLSTGRNAGASLGSIAVVVPATRGGKLRMWRLFDEPAEKITLARARRMTRLWVSG